LNFALAWIVSLVYVGAKAYQQRVVQHAQYLRMPLMSYVMAFCEVFVITIVSRHYDDAWSLAALAACIGTGAWMGSMLGTYVHERGRRGR
jgi:hypothetical protein